MIPAILNNLTLFVLGLYLLFGVIYSAWIVWSARELTVRFLYVLPVFMIFWPLIGAAEILMSVDRDKVLWSRKD